MCFRQLFPSKQSKKKTRIYFLSIKDSILSVTVNVLVKDNFSGLEFFAQTAMALSRFGLRTNVIAVFVCAIEGILSIKRWI